MFTGRQRIAIIGSGISGLGAAYLLNLQHDIVVYEKNAYAGGHARTLNIDYHGEKIAVDTGFIVFNHRNYPHLTALFKKLDIPSRQTSMSFGFKADDGSLEWGAESINAVFAQRKNLLRPAFWRFIHDVFRFNGRAVQEVRKNPSLNLGQLIKHLGLGEWFAKFYILPIGGAIWSCPLQDMLGFPASFFVDFFDAHGLLTVNDQPQWYSVIGGSQVYVERLTSGFKDKIRLSCAVQRVTRQNYKVQVTDGRGVTEEFDQVIFACHAPETLALLGDASAIEHSVFSVFRHQKNTAILHKHVGIMPRRRACWSSWVYHAKNEPGPEPITVTYWMNYLQGIDHRYPLFVSLNPRRPIPEADIFDRHEFYHPIYDPASVAAQPKIAALQGQNNTWFCGAYHRYGFHEDGLASAVDVASRTGVTPPWA